MKERKGKRKREEWELEGEIGVDRISADGSCSYFKCVSQSGASHMSPSDCKVQIQIRDCSRF